MSGVLGDPVRCDHAGSGTCKMSALQQSRKIDERLKKICLLLSHLGRHCAAVTVRLGTF